VRFTTFCKAALALGPSSHFVFRVVKTKCHSRQQTLQLMRWLAASPRNILRLDLTAWSQFVPLPQSQLDAVLSLQAPLLKPLHLRWVFLLLSTHCVEHAGLWVR